MIFSKLGVASRIQAGIYAARIGLAAPDVRPTVRGG
jgi:DNA-binding NarL/FixJ family response regulator